MIPKTELRYSRIYNSMYNPRFSEKDLDKLIKDNKKFERLYKKYIKRILKLIERHRSKRWKYSFIPIYIVRERVISFSDPLTLRYDKNEKFMLVTLAHELLHNNLDNQKFKDSKEMHIYMEPILNKIIRDLQINLEKELKEFNKIIRRFYKIKNR